MTYLSGRIADLYHLRHKRQKDLPETVVEFYTRFGKFSVLAVQRY